MTGRDAARDELINTLRTTTIRVLPDRTLELVAEALLSRGYRRSVTPTEIEGAAKVISVADACGLDLDGDDWNSDANESQRLHYVRMAGAAARAFGLEVTDE